MYGTEFILPSSAQVLSMSLKFETPSTKAAEGVFSVSIILIALVVPCDQNLSQAYKLIRGGTRRA